MIKSRNRSSLLAKYTLQYEKNPKSRVFAPLAEIYRNLGMMDEAFKLLREGIKHHPSYTLGYIVLSHCYFDNNNFDMAYNTIRPFVSKNLENITLQKLFARTCENLGFLEEALQTYKYLLLLNPKDELVASKVKELEDDLSHIEEEVQIETQSISDSNEDDWVQVDFNKKKIEDEDSSNDWKMNVRSPLEDFKQEIKAREINVKEHNIDDQFYHEDYDDENYSESEQEQNSPIITHTLVDLYCGQGHIDKAIEILENILDLHPNDYASQKRLLELKNNQSIETDSVYPKENLLSEKYDQVKFAFELFEQKLQERFSRKQEI